MNKRWFISSVLVIVVAAGGYTFLGMKPAPPPLPTIKVNTGTIENQALAVGKIVPVHAIEIKSQIDGIVGEIYAKVGEKIKKGQPLVKVRPNPTPQDLTSASSEVLRSEAELESAQQKLNNYKSLIKQKIIPENYGEYVSAKAAVKSAKAVVEQRRQTLELIKSGEASIGSNKLTSTITAPIDGTVLNRQVDVGDPIISTSSNQAATKMMSLANMSNIAFKGSVSEHDAAKLTVGMPVSVTLAPYPDVVIKGVLEEVAIQSEKLNAVASDAFDNGFQVEVGQLVIPPEVTVRSGFSATAHITLKKVADVLTLPERVLKFDGDTANVMVPDDSEKGFHLKTVKLGLSDGINAQVLEGVGQGDTVIDASQAGVDHE
ncbi:efflux RND transporter periplasmic adaptor subunit [Veronia pacifica]|uniref:Efflux transporter periplasmic adaptor subunit n=1 Tax=Veronia pacifica TaxID=1080227 RepID=A0A1C3EJ70_9GAMM|nr:efflux RND transporter periplasmic adaptor subunit [Veronia pacifica]ODA33273.1 efflux transporter periplasmic adaptor subunit [Veronia pacifica]